MVFPYLIRVTRWKSRKPVASALTQNYEIVIKRPFFHLNTRNKNIKIPFRYYFFLSSDISLLNILNIQKVSVYSKVYKATKTF